MSPDINDSEIVCQLPADNTGRLLTIKTKWRDDSLCVTIFDGMKTFSGIMSKECITDMSNQLGIEANQYIEECKSALTTSGGYENFIYKIDDNSTFVWKKVGLDMKIKFGFIQLNMVPVCETLNDIINATVKSNHLMHEQLKEVKKERDLLSEANSELLQKIDDCICLKNNMEIQLYDQFLMVLNTKKRKIAKLEKQLESRGKDVCDISNDNNNEEEQEEEKNLKKKLYECETDVDTDSDNGKEQQNKNVKESIKCNRDNSSYESDLEETDDKICDIPKRYPVQNKKSSESAKNELTASSEIESYFNNSSSCKKEDKKNVSNDKDNNPKPRKKRLSNEKDEFIFNNDCCNEAGPSGIKVPKVTSNKKDENHQLSISTDLAFALMD
ncbi:uncharacterized protein LOC142324997 isoform X2 [Lycorma delicatula]|uniref:uncharacterized protein LOC142324997 isoform X2 n=1 Tax=Lycorma delicatula TaxID=130591 RepID=UPI003F514B7E